MRSVRLRLDGMTLLVTTGALLVLFGLLGVVDTWHDESRSMFNLSTNMVGWGVVSLVYVGLRSKGRNIEEAYRLGYDLGYENGYHAGLDRAEQDRREAERAAKVHREVISLERERRRRPDGTDGD